MMTTIETPSATNERERPDKSLAVLTERANSIITHNGGKNVTLDGLDNASVALTRTISESRSTGKPLAKYDVRVLPTQEHPGQSFSWTEEGTFLEVSILPVDSDWEEDDDSMRLSAEEDVDAFCQTVWYAWGALERFDWPAYRWQRSAGGTPAQ